MGIKIEALQRSMWSDSSSDDDLLLLAKDRGGEWRGMYGKDASKAEDVSQ